MRAARSLLIVALLPLFAGCQVFTQPPENPNAGLTRMQGELTAAGGQLLFQPCQESRRFIIHDSGNTSVLQEAAALASKPGKLFVDLGGRFAANPTAGADGQVNLQRLYRLEHEGPGCQDPNFKRLVLHARGHEPEWNVNVSTHGMVLERIGQAPLALPYLEEQMGEGRFNLSSEANNQHIELWVAPQHCQDGSDGSINHLSAELRINGQVQRGCAYFGGSRND